ncbi:MULTISPECIES: replication-associated recombination protein A [unclassified Granulicatella]|uniref:replication-associated recombination protein A n=1 Tax=unclassified Granulicatella TaxID=2630493 RepID=UPI0010731F4B|nr:MULTISPECIES: replication-associated recombination protein A [unclassified Granulicatella]MBF0780083.1 replication-associated recombination protein A [Granulicatella sp. 19428wC4_WM01]TFU95809.1 replication-associated recombination protein A [Granulicatella sp. WM01]
MTNLKPLAFRMRPKHIEHIVGQQHLVGQEKIIQRMVISKRLSSMILYGPPGIGKTSIASAIAGSMQLPFRTLNAATDSKKDLDIVVEEAKLTGQVILLLDEIHRLNKVKQDFLLPHLESGLIILIGATTENPFISINPAIRSRTQIFELFPLSEQDIANGIQFALKDTQNGLGNYQVDLSQEALIHLSRATGGDLRSSLNALELAVLSTPADEDNIIHITTEITSECLQKKFLVHDKGGDAHYDTISAFQKSIRGSDVDASLHYLARLIESGDLPTIARRLTVVAYEDIGFANPSAVHRTLNAIQSAERLGFPEARIPLAMAVIDLALSPKSNSTIMAIDHALSDVKKGNYGQIPPHLRDNHYQGAEYLGRGNEYKYPHHYPNHWVKQEYLPKELKDKRYYIPNTTGRYEQLLANQLMKFRDSLS